MNTRLMLTLATSLSLVAGGAVAHDFFLIPERFVGPAGQPLIVHATSSSDFPALNVGSPLARVGEARAMVNGRPAQVAVDAPSAIPPFNRLQRRRGHGRGHSSDGLGRVQLAP